MKQSYYLFNVPYSALPIYNKLICLICFIGLSKDTLVSRIDGKDFGASMGIARLYRELYLGNQGSFIFFACFLNHKEQFLFQT